MYLLELRVTKLDTDKEVAQAAMIGDIADLKDKGSVMEIMERMGNFIMEFNSEKKGQVE